MANNVTGVDTSNELIEYEKKKGCEHCCKYSFLTIFELARIPKVLLLTFITCVCFRLICMFNDNVGEGENVKKLEVHVFF